MQDESQKEVVFIRNKGSNSEDDMGYEEFLDTIRCVVVRCTLVQPKDTIDWRRNTIFPA